MATAPALYRKLPYNPLTDFEYVSQVIDVPMTLVGRKDLPAKDFKELLAYLKANGDKVNLAHAGLGAVSHLCGMLFRQAVGRGADHRAVPGHRPGDERAAGRTGRPAVRPDDLDHAAHQGRIGEALRRDDGVAR